MRRRNTALHLILLALPALLGSAAIFYATAPWGPWVFSDSVEYLLTAKNLLAGNGFGLVSPSGQLSFLNLHPPLYPLAISATGLLGIDVVQGARWLGIILFASSIFILSLLFDQWSGKTWYGMGIGILMASSPILIHQAMGAMTEILYFFLLVTSLALLTRYLRQNRMRLLILAAVTTGLGVLTRYIGVAIVGAGMLGVVLMQGKPLLRRIWESTLFGVIGVLPTGVWLIIMYANAGGLAGRSFLEKELISTRFETFRGALVNQIWSWLPFHAEDIWSPKYRVKLAGEVVLIILAALVAGWIAWRAWRSGRLEGLQQPELLFGGLIFLHTIAYTAGMALSYLFSSPQPDLDGRNFSPILIGCLLALFAPLVALHGKPQRKIFTLGLPMLAMIILVGSQYSDTRRTVQEMHQDGNGYLSRQWHDSATTQAVRELPAGTPIITDQPAALYFLTGKPAYAIRELEENQPVSAYTTYGSDLEDPAQRIFREQGGALVLFKAARWKFENLYYKETLARMEVFTAGLDHPQSYFDGDIYFFPKDQ